MNNIIDPRAERDHKRYLDDGDKRMRELDEQIAFEEQESGDKRIAPGPAPPRPPRRQYTTKHKYRGLR